MPTKKEPTFEKALERLDEIVALLESADAPLDKALSLFEEGVKLVKLCNEKLDSADATVKQLVSIDGELVEQDFLGDEDEN
ncbi:MAG: exodeoxyribonuclease VII small subunit [Clostridia bacterium]|nr:exodeoxyribonuclease VII small subunit [Clostridia bacterium]